jgi:hypothetical protein
MLRFPVGPDLWGSDYLKDGRLFGKAMNLVATLKK